MRDIATEAREFLIPSKEIRICQDENSYWLFDNQWIKETNLTENDPTSEWVKGIKPLKKGINEFEGNFVNGYYLIRVKIDSKSLAVSFYMKDWNGIINMETYKLFRHKSFEKDEKGAIITPQVFAYLEDFRLLKTKKIEGSFSCQTGKKQETKMRGIK